MWLVLAEVLQVGLPALALRGRIHGVLPVPWLVRGLFLFLVARLKVQAGHLRSHIRNYVCRVSVLIAIRVFPKLEVMGKTRCFPNKTKGSPGSFLEVF